MQTVVLPPEFRNLVWEKSLRRKKKLRGKITFPKRSDTAGTRCPSAEKSMAEM